MGVRSRDACSNNSAQTVFSLDLSESEGLPPNWNTSKNPSSYGWRIDHWGALSNQNFETTGYKMSMVSTNALCVIYPFYLLFQSECAGDSDYLISPPFIGQPGRYQLNIDHLFTGLYGQKASIFRRRTSDGFKVAIESNVPINYGYLQYDLTFDRGVEYVIEFLSNDSFGIGSGWCISNAILSRSDDQGNFKDSQ